MRYYEIDGEQYPSVTTVLAVLAKPEPLIKWIANLGYEESQNKLKEAGERGTRVHTAIEHYLLTGIKRIKKLKPDEKGMFNSFLRWQKEHKPKIIQTEQTLYSQKYGYAGTTDLIAKIDNKLCLIDFKTSNRLQDVYGIQLVAYKKAYEELYKQKIDKTYVLHLKQTKYVFHEFKTSFKVFLAMLTVFKWLYQKDPK